MAELDRDAVHERILRAERIRNGRRLAALRTITLAFFVANALVMNLLFEPRGSYRGLVVMTGYFILAVGLWLAVRRSEAVAFDVKGGCVTQPGGIAVGAKPSPRMRSRTR